MNEDMNVLSWSIIVYSGIQYFVMMLSMSASPISSDQLGTVIKLFVTSSIMHKMYLCPSGDLGITFKSILSLDNGV